MVSPTAPQGSAVTFSLAVPMVSLGKFCGRRSSYKAVMCQSFMAQTRHKCRMLLQFRYSCGDSRSEVKSPLLSREIERVKFAGARPPILCHKRVKSGCARNDIRALTMPSWRLGTGGWFARSRRRRFPRGTPLLANARQGTRPRHALRALGGELAASVPARSPALLERLFGRGRRQIQGHAVHGRGARS